MAGRLLACVLAISGMLWNGQAIAEWQPPGPIKLMIAFAAGGGADTQARLIAEELEARHGWEIIPEQVTGKGGAVLAAALKNEPADGSVIGMLVTESLGYNMVAAKNAGYALEDFTPITTTAGFQMGVVALSEKGWNNIHDVLAAAKGGEQLRFGAMSPKLADIAYLLGKANGVDFNIVMVKGGKAVMNGLNAGDLDLGWGAGIQNKAVLAGDMVNLASGLKSPLAVSPDAPLLADLGVDFTTDGYFMFAAPAGVPSEARDALSTAIANIVSDEQTKAGGMISKAFGGSVTITGDDLQSFLAEDVESAKALLAAASE